MKKKKQELLLVVGDLLCYYCALIIVILVRFPLQSFVAMFFHHFVPFSILFFFWSMSVFVINIFHVDLSTRNIRSLFLAFMVNLALGFTFFYVFPSFTISPKTNLALLVGISGALLVGWRYILRFVIIRLGRMQKIVIVVDTEDTLRIAEKIARHAETGYSLAAIFLHKRIVHPTWLEEHKVVVLRSVKKLVRFIRMQPISTIVFGDRWSPTAYRMLYLLAPLGIRLCPTSTFWEEVEEAIPVQASGEAWFLQNINTSVYKKFYPVVKRLLDVALALCLFPILSVLFLFCVPLIRGTSKGTVLFVQERTGRNQKSFFVYKFRTMIPQGAQTAQQWTEKNDPRITRVGRFLRKSRIDEWPQLINIIKGNMSFVGPRPEQSHIASERGKEIPHYHLRHLIKPGISGWAQVRYKYGASSHDTAMRLEYDLYYVKNMSFLLDLRIFFKTLFVILSHKGI